MKLKVALVLTVAVLAAAHWNAGAQAQRGRRGTPNGTPPASAVANEALLQALAGPEGEYANLAEYSAMVEKFGQIQPYAAILRSEECHIAALKRHLELRGVAVPENSFLGIVTAPATLPEAAEAAISAEEKNVAMYDRLLEKVKDQPDLVQVFTHLQFASREHHLPAFKAAAEKGGQLQAGEFRCGMGCGQGRAAKVAAAEVLACNRKAPHPAAAKWGPAVASAAERPGPRSSKRQGRLKTLHARWATAASRPNWHHLSPAPPSWWLRMTHC